MLRHDRAGGLPLTARDLNTRPPAITRVDGRSKGTAARIAATLRLDPGPTSAMASYIFGAASHRLVQVVLQWSYPAAATEIQRQSIAEAGALLKDDLQAGDQKPPRSDDGGATSDGELEPGTATDAS